jgi:hypothetical protein
MPSRDERMEEQIGEFKVTDLKSLIREYKLETFIRLNQSKRDLKEDLKSHLDYNKSKKVYTVKIPRKIPLPLAKGTMTIKKTNNKTGRSYTRTIKRQREKA